MLKREGVHESDCDFCRYDLRVGDPGDDRLSKKPERFVSNCPYSLKHLNLKCPGAHKHLVIMGKYAKRAEVYPQKVVNAIVAGIREGVVSRSKVARSDNEYYVSPDSEFLIESGSDSDSTCLPTDVEDNKSDSSSDSSSSMTRSL